ncbi:MAG: hypothetical protein ACAH95_15305 [Fimbriimonas sp.]
MGFLNKLFGRKPVEPSGMEDHLVRVHLPMSEEKLDRCAELEDLLGERVNAAGVGQLDGNEIGGGEYTIWLYGPQAVPLAEVVRHALEDQDLPAGSTMFMRHGGVNDRTAKEETWNLP